MVVDWLLCCLLREQLLWFFFIWDELPRVVVFHNYFIWWVSALEPAAILELEFLFFSICMSVSFTFSGFPGFRWCLIYHPKNLFLFVFFIHASIYCHFVLCFYFPNFMAQILFEFQIRPYSFHYSILNNKL